MVRPREFDTQTAIDQAMRVFLKQGYKGTSLTDLIRAMGISKSSFYETFSSKHQLFLTTLTRFHKTEALYQFIDPTIDIPAKTMITDIFRQLIDNIIEGNGGCMYGNCAIEFANTDQAVTTNIANGIKQLEQMFYQILKVEQTNGGLSENHDIKSSAQQLTATFYGLQVMTNANLEKAVLYEIAENAVAILD